jgi:hypothetical protein
MSVSCALWATSLHQWARRYIRLTQPARCSPEKRARIRAFFANGADKMGIPLAVEGLPTLLHLSLFLFFAGLGIFLFNVDREVFTCVVSWIGLFSIAYGLITLLPLIRHDSPYNTPLSIPAWFLYARIQYIALNVLTTIAFIFLLMIAISSHIIFKVLLFITFDQIKIYTDQFESFLGLIWDYPGRVYRIWERHTNRWISGGVEKKAEEMASEQSSEIDVRILGWTIRALGDDDSLEKFFETIPGLFNSKLVNHLERDFPLTDHITFCDALDGLMSRTLSSNSVTESVKSRRVAICRDIINVMPNPYYDRLNNLRSHFDQAPVTMERLQAISRWFANKDYSVAGYARFEAVKSLASMQERDDAWIAFASDMCSLAVEDLRDNIAHSRENVLLATLIHFSRRPIHPSQDRLVKALPYFDIRHTLPGLQHDFCTLWNELVQEAKKRGAYSAPIWILDLIGPHYITLHEATASTGYFSVSDPSSYPLCDIDSHRSDSVPRAVSLLTQTTDSSDDSPHQSTSLGNIVSQPVKQVNVIPGPSSPVDLTTPSEIRDSSQVPAATSPDLPIPTSPRPMDASLATAVATTPQDIPPAATLSHPHEGTTQHNIVAPCAESEISQILSASSVPASTPASAPVLVSTPPVLNETFTPGAASPSNTLLPASSVAGFSGPVSSPPSHVPPLPTAEFLSLVDGTTPFRPTGDAALPHIRPHGLVNTGSMCFSNAVLQLLVHFPPLWNLFRQLGDLKGQRGEGGPATGDGATPLVDATVRFFEEFMNKEKASTRRAVGGEAKKEPDAVDSFEPTYIYDATKEKRKLKSLLVRSRSTNHPIVTDLCWPNVCRTTDSRMRKSSSAYTSTHLTKSCLRYSLLIVATIRLLLHLE